MLNEKTDLVEYLRLFGEDEDFKDEYIKRLNIDNDENLISDNVVRLLKLEEIFNI